jgi:uncharacterized protein (TIGR02186 family)
MILRTAFLIALCLLARAGAVAQTLTADLSSHVIGITTGFVGANLVLFGATDKPGDIAVIVRGPTTDMTVRRKARILGVWLNRDSAEFRDMPSFYATAASKPLADIASQETLSRHNLGLANLRFQTAEPVPQPALDAFRTALLENQERAGLYRADPIPVTFLGEHLFRADMFFPANVPTGNYAVEVDLLSGGEVIGVQTTTLIVSRIGFSNGVYVVARHHAAWYGLGALTFAVAAGWAAGAIFRRV